MNVCIDFAGRSIFIEIYKILLSALIIDNDQMFLNLLQLLFLIT